MTDQTQQQPTDTGTPGEAPWYDEAHKPVVEAKGWKAPGDVVDSYVNLEKLFGADKAGRTIVMPKDESDEEGLKAFRAKLGVPEKPEDYELPVPEDGADFAKAAAEWFHKAGVPKSAAQAVTKELHGYFESLFKQEHEAAIATSKQALEELRKEWGGEYEQRAEFARRGFRTYGAKAGLEQADLEAIEETIGTAKMLKLFHELGATTSEGAFIEGDDKKGFGMTPQQAREKLDELRAKRIANEITEGDWQAAVERYGAIAAKAA